MQSQNYDLKTTNYFTGVRSDYIFEMPNNPEACILEVGCGTGDTGAKAISEGKCRLYCGIEISTKAAKKAREQLHQIVVGDVESEELPWKENTFDVLIISEVLEHLVDPWAVLRKLKPLLKQGALVFASSPNVAHYKVINSLIRGDWSLADSGVMDRTHLRWFTPDTYKKMFESSGYLVTHLAPVGDLGLKARVINTITFGKLKHLLWRQIDLRAEKR